ncbi:uncharacterized protein LOC125178932 [Hyalella azteca]|uniref:Uncharacterized protein LOC125178932 n=1 Tax=Hyalella azteca TaxID=294128 RepID=A0A979FTM5_HYAAZ|nr:uncharacterized protein LOC125178932 [Hyalella azteca]
MNASSLMVLVLFVGVGVASLPPPENRPKLHDPSIQEVLSSAGVFSVLFLGVYEVSRLSKGRRPNHPPPALRARRPLRRVVPLAASLLVAGVVLASFPLGLVLTLITGGG